MTSPTIPDFAAEAPALLPDLQTLRRALHADPEVGNDIPRTRDRVLAALDGLPLTVHTGESLSSVVAVLEGGRPGPTVLLRGDMDALPLTEDTGLPYASTNGAMHACGHDLHTSGLVGAARLLAAHREDLPGSVVFMFQPGEEGPGGARPMIEEGLLDVTGRKPVAAYGIHVAPGPRGTFAYRPGTTMAGFGDLAITVHGRGGHGSKPYAAVDPVAVLVEIAQALQTMVTRQFDVFDPVVLSIGRIEAGTAANIIPETGSLQAAVRVLSGTNEVAFGEAARRLAEGIAAAHGARAEVRWEIEYPVTVNDVDESAFVDDRLTSLFGADRVDTMADPLMGSEDFSFVLREVPGCFFFLAASPEDVDPETAAWNHSPQVLFDDSVLADQAAALADLAWTRLARHAAESAAGSAGTDHPAADTEGAHA
ncbi:M20 metallopeptidase family protein [Brevibacterium litoralis]|uniref:M20 metallopeptidase family protein n=1 Tax=Brevibacterium litoralis TaxID=3138935 RepID=UPI0032EC1E4B